MVSAQWNSVIMTSGMYMGEYRDASIQKIKDALIVS